MFFRSNFSQRQLFFLGFLFLIFGFLLLAPRARAANLVLTPSAGNFKIGDEFNLDITIDASNATSGINAAQAVIHFPTDNLQLISVDKTNSIFNFWLQEPAISNSDGTLSFTGGTTSGISGSALQVLRLHFKAVGAGAAQITASDAAIAANDGQGTNILSTIDNASVNIGATAVTPSAPATSPKNVPAKPQVVTRAAVPSANLPAAPSLRSPLYPDQSRWYSQSGDFVIFWDLPPDVSQVSTYLSHGRGDTGNIESQLANGKDFGILDEGIWYARVRFKNNVGWGAPAYYKISIDKTPPLPFKIKIDNPASDNPTPTISYETGDVLSGIDHYSIFIDGQGPANTTSTQFMLPPQKPGSHMALVKAVDMAGNSVEENLDFQIIPLPTPTVDFINQSISQGKIIFASGKTTPGYNVDVKLDNSQKQEVFSGKVSSDAEGNWNITIDNNLPPGKYDFSAWAQDSRGAISLPISPISVNISEKVIISIGFVNLGWYEIFIILIFLVLAIGGIFSHAYAVAGVRRGLYNTIAERDLEKLSDLISADVSKLEMLVGEEKNLDKKEKIESANYIENLKKNISKLKKYLAMEIKKIK